MLGAPNRQVRVVVEWQLAASNRGPLRDPVRAAMVVVTVLYLQRVVSLRLVGLNSVATGIIVQRITNIAVINSFKFRVVTTR